MATKLSKKDAADYLRETSPQIFKGLSDDDAIAYAQKYNPGAFSQTFGELDETGMPSGLRPQPELGQLSRLARGFEGGFMGRPSAPDSGLLESGAHILGEGSGPMMGAAASAPLAPFVGPLAPAVGASVGRAAQLGMRPIIDVLQGREVPMGTSGDLINSMTDVATAGLTEGVAGKGIKIASKAWKAFKAGSGEVSTALAGKITQLPQKAWKDFLSRGAEVKRLSQKIPGTDDFVYTKIYRDSITPDGATVPLDRLEGSLAKKLSKPSADFSKEELNSVIDKAVNTLDSGKDIALQEGLDAVHAINKQLGEVVDRGRAIHLGKVLDQLVRYLESAGLPNLREGMKAWSLGTSGLRTSKLLPSMGKVPFETTVRAGAVTAAYWMGGLPGMVAAIGGQSPIAIRGLLRGGQLAGVAAEGAGRAAGGLGRLFAQSAAQKPFARRGQEQDLTLPPPSDIRTKQESNGKLKEDLYYNPFEKE